MKTWTSFLRAIVCIVLIAGTCQIAIAQKVIKKQKVTFPTKNLPLKEWLTPVPAAPAIAFRPFTLQELQAKVPGLKATDLVPLKNPKTSRIVGQIRASALVDSLNKYEQSFNRLGTSLRNPDAVKKMSRKLNVNTQLIQTRKSAFQSRLKTTAAPPAFLSMTESQRVDAQRTARAAYAQERIVLKKLIAKNPSPAPPPATISGGNSATCDLGDPGTFAFELGASASENATNQELSVENSSKLKVMILGESMDLVGVGAKLAGGPTSYMYTPSGEILGLSFSGSAEQLTDWKYDKTEVPFDGSYSWTVTIYDGILAILSVGVHADVVVAMNVDPREAYVGLEVSPWASTSVTVGVGVTVGGVVGIELQGELQFFNGGINVWGMACEETKASGKDIQDRLTVSDYCNTWGSALGGDLSLYWWLGVCPYFCVDGTIPLYTQAGTDLYGELFNDEPKSTEWVTIHRGFTIGSTPMPFKGTSVRDSYWARQGSWQSIAKPTL
jgi:hypothetical protein